MGKFFYVNLNVSSNNSKSSKTTKRILMEEGCRYENENYAYTMSSDGKLSIFNKKNKKVVQGSDNISLDTYEYQVLNNVMNNCDDGKKIVALSEQDIKQSLRQYRNGKLTADITNGLNNGYKLQNPRIFSNENKLSVYITNGIRKASAVLAFQFGVNATNITPKQTTQKSTQVSKNTAASAVQKASASLKNSNKAISAQKPNGAEQKISSVSSKPHANKASNNVEAKLSKYIKKQPEVAPERLKTNLVSEMEARLWTGNQQSARMMKMVNATIESMPDFYQQKLKVLAQQTGLSMQELKQQIRDVAKETNYSEYFVAHIVSMEDYEPVVRNTNDGTITGGFGHTKLRDKSLALGKEVKPEEAFRWLANDIKFFEKKVKSMVIDSQTGKTYGDYFNELPLSMQEALVDLAFNRDVRTLEASPEYESLRANIKKGYYAASTVRIRQKFDYTFDEAKGHKFTTGLMERNVYRFLLATRDLSPQDTIRAKRLFEKDGYFSMAQRLKLYKGYRQDVKLMNQAWDNK